MQCDRFGTPFLQRAQNPMRALRAALNCVRSAAGPRRLARYELHDEIAAGGMAQIHLGWLVGDVGFGRVVVLKRLRASLARDVEFVAMLLDEARVAARVRHPYLLTASDVVVDGDDVFLVMDHVHGETLADLMRRVTH